MWGPKAHREVIHVQFGRLQTAWPGAMHLLSMNPDSLWVGSAWQPRLGLLTGTEMGPGRSKHGLRLNAQVLSQRVCGYH